MPTISHWKKYIINPWSSFWQELVFFSSSRPAKLKLNEKNGMRKA